MTTFTSEDRENAMKDEEYAGGIPIPFMGWAQIDQEDTEKMLRDQLHMVNQRLQEANQLIGEQKKVLELLSTQFVWLEVDKALYTFYYPKLPRGSM